MTTSETGWIRTPYFLASKRDINVHRAGSRALQVCNAMCNTDKHHTRSTPSDMTARIRTTSLPPNAGAVVTVEVDWGTNDATKWDALELAHECVESWRTFFAARGIPEP